MKKQKKFLAVLSAAAVSTMIAAAVSTTAFAKTTDVIAKIDGQEVKINFEELITAYENEAAGLDSELFNKYNKREGLTALLDDKNGFVDYKAVQEAAEDAVALGEKFVLNDFTENTEKTLADFKHEAEWKDGKVVPVTPVEEDLKVESVSAINAKQVEVKFNKAIKENTVISNTTTGALQTDTVTVSRTVNDTVKFDKNVTNVNGFLSKDGKTLTLTAAGTTYFDGTYAITVSDNVKDVDGKAIKAYAGTFSMKDETNPVVSEVKFDTVTNKIIFTFSEPIKAEPEVVRLNGNPVSGAAFVTNSNNMKLELAKPGSIAAGTTVDVYVGGAEDYAGNLLNLYNGKVEIPSDPAAPQVSSVEQISSNKAKVVFSKSIASNDTTIDGALTVIMGGKDVTTDFTAALDTTDTSKKTVIVKYSGTDPAPHYFYGADNNSKTLTLLFEENKIIDVFGKKLPATTKDVKMVKDLQGPKAVSAKVTVDGDKIEVTFDEEIAETGRVGNIELRKDGIALSTVTSANRKGTSKGEEKVLVIVPDTADLDATTSKLPAGNYTLRLATDAIQDAHTNKNEAVNLTFTVAGETEKLEADIKANTTANEFEVEFSEAVTESALNPANYTLDGKTLPSNTDIYFKGKTDPDNKTAVIVLPEGTVNIGAVGTGTNAILGVKNVVSKTGKTVVAITGKVLVEDNTPAVAQKVEVLGNDIIITFSEAIDDTTATAIDEASLATNFAIKVDGEDLTLGTVGSGATADGSAAEVSVSLVAGSPEKVRITLTPAVANSDSTDAEPTNWNPKKPVTVKVLDTTTLEDANGVVVKGNVTVSK